jgi:hypothetical protein
MSRRSSDIYVGTCCAKLLTTNSPDQYWLKEDRLCIFKKNNNRGGEEVVQNALMNKVCARGSQKHGASSQLVPGPRRMQSTPRLRTASSLGAHAPRRHHLSAEHSCPCSLGSEQYTSCQLTNDQSSLFYQLARTVKAWLFGCGSREKEYKAQGKRKRKRKRKRKEVWLEIVDS